MRVAFSKAIVDPEFIAAMKAQGYPIDPIDGASVEQIVGKLYATPASALEGVRKLRNPSS